MLRKSGEPEMGVSGTRANVHPTDGARQIESTDRTTAAVRAQRWAGVVKWISAALIVIALFVIIPALPVDQAIDLLKSKVAGLGFWGRLHSAQLML